MVEYLPCRMYQSDTLSLGRESLANVEKARAAQVPREFPIVIEPLSEGDGCCFLAAVPELPGCVSDGKTRVADAVAAWIEEVTRPRRAIPEPSIHPALAGE